MLSVEDKIKALYDEADRLNSAQLRFITQALRLAVTGDTAGPPLFEVMAILGRDECLKRLDNFIACLKP